MKTIKADEGKLILWRERKIATDSLFTPDDFDTSVLEYIPQAEGERLKAEWEEEERREAEALREEDSSRVEDSHN